MVDTLHPHQTLVGRLFSGNNFIASLCVIFVFAMLGASYAAVPLYDLFCRVTGFGGTVQQVAINPGRILSEKIRIRFDANLGTSGLSLFRPVLRTLETKIGKTQTIYYEAINDSADDIWVTAAFNVSPDITGVYFNKIDCFCYKEQKIPAMGRVKMPVTFFIDPDIIDDKNWEYVNEITLSYTFYSIDTPEDDT